MGTKRVGHSRIQKLINDNQKELYHRHPGYIKLTETKSLQASDSGKHILFGPLDGGLSADATLNLPTAEDGLHFKIQYVGGAADAHTLLISTGSNTNYFIGGIAQHDPDNAGDDTVVYHPNLSSNSKVQLKTPDSGTFVELTCDGTNWFINGALVSATDTGVVFADQ